MRILMLAAALALAAIAAPAEAKKETKPAAATNIPLGQFVQESQAEIQKDLRRGQYQAISEEHEAEVLSALERMVELTAGANSIHDLTADGRAQLLTDQELVNTRLTKAAEDSRLICDRQQTVGTHFKRTTCMTVAERRELLETSRASLIRSAYMSPSLQGGSEAPSLPGLGR